MGAKNPQERIEEYCSKYECIISFKKKFNEKTLNEWEKRANFKQKPGKYTLIKIDR